MTQTAPDFSLPTSSQTDEGLSKFIQNIRAGKERTVDPEAIRNESGRYISMLQCDATSIDVEFDITEHCAPTVSKASKLSAVSSIITSLYTEATNLRREFRRHPDDPLAALELEETVRELRMWQAKETELSGEKQAREDTRKQFAELVEKAMRLATTK